MKIEINAAQLDLILAGLNSLSEGAESEKRCCGNDPDIIETDDAVIQSTEALYKYLRGFSVQTRREQAMACRAAIDAAINSHYDGLRMDANAAVAEVLSQFNWHLVARILADTIAAMPWDGRYSLTNREWAEVISFSPMGREVTLHSDSGLVNMFTGAFRKNEN